MCNGTAHVTSSGHVAVEIEVPTLAHCGPARTPAPLPTRRITCPTACARLCAHTTHTMISLKQRSLFTVACQWQDKPKKAKAF